MGSGFGARFFLRGVMPSLCGWDARAITRERRGVSFVKFRSVLRRIDRGGALLRAGLAARRDPTGSGAVGAVDSEEHAHRRDDHIRSASHLQTTRATPVTPLHPGDPRLLPTRPTAPLAPHQIGSATRPTPPTHLRRRRAICPRLYPRTLNSDIPCAPILKNQMKIERPRSRNSGLSAVRDPLVEA